MNIRTKLISNGFQKENIHIAKLDKAGNVGEYVAMIWPPGTPKEIIVSQIVEKGTTEVKAIGMGAWSTIEQRELYRISL